MEFELHDKGLEAPGGLNQGICGSICVLRRFIIGMTKSVIRSRKIKGRGKEYQVLLLGKA